VAFAGAGAAAVEAAVAAINAAIAGATTSQRQNHNHNQSHLPHQQQQHNDFSGNAAAGSSRSFYKALMETGGILKPPGGPPIPLNVDFVREIQPHLGKLLGRGGFGAVYEATWRGKQVTLCLQCVYMPVVFWSLISVLLNVNGGYE
jgi:hypothetical protein